MSPWYKLDDSLTSKSSVLRIPRAHRLPAIGLFAMAGSWSARELTDGHIPTHMLEELAGTAEVAARLVEVGLWTEAGDGWQFVDWEPDQPLRVAVLADREKRAAKMRDWRSRNTASNPATDRATSGDTDASVPDARPVPSQPVPSRPDPSPTSKEEGREPPPRKCPIHIADPTSPPCGACRDARLTREDWDKVHPSDSKYDRAMSVIELGRSVDRARGVTRPPRAREITGMCPIHAEYPANPCDLCKRIEEEERDAA